jgi:hypothetical protein
LEVRLWGRAPRVWSRAVGSRHRRRLGRSWPRRHGCFLHLDVGAQRSVADVSEHHCQPKRCGYEPSHEQFVHQLIDRIRTLGRPLVRLLCWRLQTLSLLKVLQVLRSPGDVFRVVASAAWPVGSVSFVVQCEFRELPAVLHILVAREPPAESMQRSMAATRYGRPACLAMCVISVAGT